MSRSCACLLSIGIAILSAVAAVPASAQDAADSKVDAMVTTARAAYGPYLTKPRCGAGSGNGDEIVVCATDNKEFRVSPTSETDPDSHEALYDGLPRAPQLDRGSCRGQPGCIIGGYAPPPVYYIDLKAIPDAPAGSDAEKVAKGELQDR